MAPQPHPCPILTWEPVRMPSLTGKTGVRAQGSVGQEDAGPPAFSWGCLIYRPFLKPTKQGDAHWQLRTLTQSSRLTHTHPL